MFSEDKELEAIQKRCLGIFQVFQDLCKKNNLRYYISGGTLLGCIRHGGFIPWDNDMDIAMPREDYEKLITIANNNLPERYRLMHYSFCDNDESPLTHHVQIVDTQTVLLKLWTLKQREISIWIDIFPLDGLPGNAVKRKLHILHGRFWWLILQIAWFKDNVDIKKERPFFERIAVSIIRHMPGASNKTILQIMKHYDAVAKKYPFVTSEKIYSFHGIYGSKEMLHRKWYETGTEVIFEDIPCNAPLAYDEILKHYYGNYQNIKVQKDKHLFSVVRL